MFTIVYLVIFSVFIQMGLESAIVATTCVSLLMQIAMALWARRLVAARCTTDAQSASGTSAKAGLAVLR